MAIIPNRDLLGCNTLRDWAAVSSEMPQLLEGEGAGLPPQRRNMLLYFALQGAAPLHTCIVRYQRQFLLLYGAAELRALLDFLFLGTPVEREAWRFPLPLPGDKPRLTAADLPRSERERILSVRTPHCDFTVDTREDMELLRTYYMPMTSSAIC